jgi:cyclopropane fatty-acyl-phospholipid synthase-like methyltransferase
MDASNRRQFWEAVTPGHRHIVDHMPNGKKKRLIARFREHCLAQVQLQKLRLSEKRSPIVWDWGCGGGLLAKVTKAEGAELVLLDISLNSLREAEHYVGPGSVTVQHLHDTVRETDLQKLPSPDLVVCYNVIHHFERPEELDSLVRNCNYVGSPQVAITAKIGSLHMTADYRRDYVHGLVLPIEEIEKRFAYWGYEQTYFASVDTTRGEPLGHFVFTHLEAL